MSDAHDSSDSPVQWRAPTAVRTVAFVLCAAACSWYLLQELAALLRPLLIAVLLAYVVAPYHARLRSLMGTAASLGVIASAASGGLLALGLVSYASVLELRDEIPELQARAGDLAERAELALKELAPWLLPPETGDKPFARVSERAGAFVVAVLSRTANAALEAGVVALYLMFLLVEGVRFPSRVRVAYQPERAEHILNVAEQVNSAVVNYLKAKVRSSLFLAVPVSAVLAVLGVKFALLWGVLTFLCNFIPYLGSVVAYVLPVGFAFLCFGPVWQAFAVAGALLALHALSAALVEPLLLGKAVGISPLVILVSLALWGLLWGVPGMFLAVPLTVVAIIVMDQFESSRSVARLLKGG
jgi:AI-2 transport protein TqsA